ncbi:unnamed protein product [Ambrosiozyma monospora]|uniref:Unnamed protein product n=1 Tax=Ambrosiozyma monospora TaxID=43982 RepID=A0ACB5SXE9_AMBMO|nr:unnamed protein product [Ambrosiozyma monospora]
MLRSRVLFRNTRSSLLRVSPNSLLVSKKTVSPLLYRFNSSTAKVADISSSNYKSSYYGNPSNLSDLDTFARRHLGPSPENVEKMLAQVGAEDIDSFIGGVVPDNVLVKRKLNIEPLNGYSESGMLKRLKEIASKNKVLKSYIGKGYYGTILPGVIQRNLLENPAWYTSYTPYQPEVSQGRLESLLNYQTVVSDLTGLPVANSSLLDEGTAAAEAMIMAFTSSRGKKSKFFVDKNTHAQTIGVLQGRAKTQGIELIITDLQSAEGIAQLKDNQGELCGALLSYPGTDGSIGSIMKLTEVADIIHKNKGLFAVASDLLALTLLHPPSAFGADIVLGSSQRFGVPMGFGGPHAAFFAVTQKLQRKMPGRLVGVSKDRLGYFQHLYRSSFVG